MQKLVLATRNKGKLSELKELLKGLPVELLSLTDFDMPEILEDGETFKENALIKAKAVYEHTGIPSIADDSGLEIDYLGGQPGVYSARFAGEHGDDEANNQKVLQLLEGIPFGKRNARFKCVIAIVGLSRENIVTTGTCEGVITTASEGQNGFGYDPIFWITDFERTMAEISLEQKNLISHRAVALRKAKKELVKILPWG